MAPDELDCSHADELICPYCGEEQGDSWELQGEDGEMACGSCCRSFGWSRHVSVSYTSRPIVGPHRLSDIEQQWDAQARPLEKKP